MSCPGQESILHPAADTKISADSSSCVFGAMFLQKQQCVHIGLQHNYTSRSLIETESHYAQIKKEALGMQYLGMR